MSKTQQFSVIEYCSRQEKNRCGYCCNPNTSYSHGMSAHSLTVQDYQNLIDRGWRRSGTYCYKPIMDVTCCPHYTIKCEALNFKISKSQKRTLKRLIKFLKNELQNDEKTSPVEKDTVKSMEIADVPQFSETKEMDASKMQVSSISEELVSSLSPSVNCIELSTSISKQTNKNAQVSNLSSQSIDASKPRSSKFCDSSMNVQKKAKLIRIERARSKLAAQGKSPHEIDEIVRKKKLQKAGKTLEDYFNEINGCSNKLEIKSLRVMSDEFLDLLDDEADLFKKYQMAIHKDTLEDCNKLAFFEFLVQNPLQEWTPDDGPPQGYGAFHEQYWLNGQLIAVAVIDILPYCISSVYLFYDPAYSFLSLGTISSLREVVLTRQLNKYAPSLKFYYMGYYIHTCPKMCYKAKMRPSKLLCPESYVWCDINDCLKKLDVSKYSRLNDDSNAQDEDGNVNINQVLVLYERKAMHYRVWKNRFPNSAVDSLIREYACLVGKKCATSMLYYIRD
ncbi:arginyl-tRNA--protein transferase 1 [Copidosoma floridanum]|uniref:arginyl-tRNA--protein transferase 1 n=1 Tax=Copidosoma floridanum TaxID=29053 RepID=UPI0006C9B421|nr:arginyl-tRNA--protein transferase 1 [Copidosoma floridanum]